MDTVDEIINIFQKANNIILDKEKLMPIYNMMTKHIIGKKQIVFHQDDDTKGTVYLLFSGVIRLYYIDLDGRDITRFFGTRGCVGGYIDNYLPYTVETIEASEFYTIELNKLEKAIEDDIYWLRIWNQLLKNSIRYKIYREASFLTESATERYINFKRTYPDLEKRVNHCYIASYLGITPESLSRIRRSIIEEK